MAVAGRINFIDPPHGVDIEKPYQLKFEPPEGFSSTNIVSSEHYVRLDDVRGREDRLSMAQNGLSVMRLEDNLAYEDYDDEQVVREVYFKQVADGLMELLQATRVQIFEHVLRKRHAEFPVATGQAYKYNQPTNTAHIDVTLAWAQGTAEHMNELKGSALPSEHLQFINVWKPLRGPIKDWPLAVCDASSVASTDIRESDIVFADRVIENYLVQANPEQRWYYLSDQMPTEAWVFLQADSNQKGLHGTPHSSFLHPDNADSCQPRESIEVRAIAYFDRSRHP